MTMPLSYEDQADIERKAFYARFDAAVATLTPDLRKHAHFGRFLEEKDGSWVMHDTQGNVLAKHRSERSIAAEAAAAEAARVKAVQRQQKPRKISIYDLDPQSMEEFFGGFCKELGLVLKELLSPIRKSIAELEKEGRIDGQLIEELAATMEKVEALEKGIETKGLFTSDRDERGIADALIDREGHLVLSMTDGTTKNLGRVVGRDGISLESRQLSYDEEAHEVVERWCVGETTREFRYPASGIHYGGFWREGMTVQASRAVTHAGSLWIALRETREKPCRESEDWCIAARKGRDAK